MARDGRSNRLAFRPRSGRKKANGKSALAADLCPLPAEMSAESTADRVDDVQLERICKAARKVDDAAACRPIDSLVYAQPFEPGCFKLIEVTEAIAARVLDGEK